MPSEVDGELRPLVPSIFPIDVKLSLTGLSLDPPDSPVGFSLAEHTLGALGVSTQVSGDVPEVILRQPFDPASLTGIDARSVRVFRIETESCSFRPVWDSGINVKLGFVWSRIRRPGLYAPLGLPRDRLLSEMLRALARARSYRDPQTLDESRELAEQILTPILQAGEKEIDKIRRLLTRLEIETFPGVFLPGEIRLGRDAIPLPFPLPGGMSTQDLRRWLLQWFAATPMTGLPEELLFFPPEKPDDAEPPWLILPERPLPRPLPQPASGEPLPTPWPPRETALPDDRLRYAERLLGGYEVLAYATSPEIFGWLFSRQWWMHHRNAEHTGDARCSAIRRTNVKALVQRSKVCLDGPIISMPCVVAGKIYVGTGNRPGATGGTLYKIDLGTGCVDASFSFSGKEGDWRALAGVGSSPAVTDGKVYFSALTGKVYCLDAATLACLWVTDLRHTDGGQNQPVEHGDDVLANGWSSPVVANQRVYVACGDGESNTFGFVYCLNAATGKVIWLFCTNQFEPGVDNKPNVIPFSACPGVPPAPFTKAAIDPPERGASPWSAPAYCAVLNRIYIGTGNSEDDSKFPLPPDDPLPDPLYASGILSLNATTGDFKGFFQPCPTDSYRPAYDADVDVPAGPMLFTRAGKRYVCFGSKNGSFFLLDARTMAVVARRQLLPKDSASNPLPHIDQPAGSPHENKSGVFGTAALDCYQGRIFIGLGGYLEPTDTFPVVDHETTPFIRAVDWETLADAWPTVGTDPPLYSAAHPPVYCTENEAALSSPAVVNDVVFVSTTLPALYAFDAETGLCLWVAPGIMPAPKSYALGPAIYGNYVVNGLSNGVLYIYSL
jgi:outer membrane protein assembly factor BamB